ncbi:MAG: hypothetical protein RSC93_01735 [Erysipelotrichaceae bacterium]
MDSVDTVFNHVSNLKNYHNGFIKFSYDVHGFQFIMKNYHTGKDKVLINHLYGKPFNPIQNETYYEPSWKEYTAEQFYKARDIINDILGTELTFENEYCYMLIFDDYFHLATRSPVTQCSDRVICFTVYNEELKNENV